MPTTRRYFKIRPNIIYYTVIALSLAYCSPVFSGAAEDAPWPVKATPSFKPIYGSMIGVSAQDGDYIGLFDGTGNCYGVGLVRSGKYFASAYWQSPARELFDDDYTDKGFENGDEVFFKIYRRETKEELELQPDGGAEFYFMYEETAKDQPAKVDLAYKRSFHVEVPVPPEDADSGVSAGEVSGRQEEPVSEAGSPSSGASAGGISGYPVGSIKFPGAEEAGDVSAEAKDAAEEMPGKIEQEILAKKDEPAGMDEESEVFAERTYEEYESMDQPGRRGTYIEAKQPAPPVEAKAKESSGDTDERLKAVSPISGKKEKEKEIVLAKAVAKSGEIAGEKAKNERHGSALPVILIAVGSVFILFAIFLALFKRREEEDVEKNRDV